jgi:type I restriction enzyme M protein
MIPESNQKRIAETFFKWQSEDWKINYKNVPEFCYSADIDEIRKKDYSLVPSRYIEFINKDKSIDYEEEMKKLQMVFRKTIEEQRKNQLQLEEAFEEVGYGIK